jgi:hypothetical protein
MKRKLNVSTLCEKVSGHVHVIPASPLFPSYLSLFYIYKGLNVCLYVTADGDGMVVLLVSGLDCVLYLLGSS